MTSHYHSPESTSGLLISWESLSHLSCSYRGHQGKRCCSVSSILLVTQKVLRRATMRMSVMLHETAQRYQHIPKYYLAWRVQRTSSDTIWTLIPLSLLLKHDPRCSGRRGPGDLCSLPGFPYSRWFLPTFHFSL